jgi:hypothetical protein
MTMYLLVRMDLRDWGLWWPLIEELGRLEALEAVAG